MFRFYIAKRVVGDWQAFMGEVNKMTDLFDEKKIEKNELDTFFLKVSEKLHVDVARWIALSKERNSLSHNETRSARSQAEFISKVQNMKFDEDLAPFVSEFVRQLKNVKLVRM
jgi:hypothetical protein